MKKSNLKFLIIFYSIILILLFSSFKNPAEITKRDGGPPYNTNAPGEKTCSGSDPGNSCHSGGAGDNTGPAKVAINFSGGATYKPGQTYFITPTISHPDRTRFGFQIVALRASDNKNIGTIKLIDTTKTRIQQPNYGSYQDRIYVMHIINGTKFSTNKGEWSYSWTAPATDKGAINFYASYVAANSNNSNDGDDQAYFTKLTITPDKSDVVEDKIENFFVYPNPTSDYIYLNENITTKNDINIYNILGVKVYESEFKNNIDVRNFTAGIYNIKIGDKCVTFIIK